MLFTNDGMLLLISVVGTNTAAADNLSLPPAPFPCDPTTVNPPIISVFRGRTGIGARGATVSVLVLATEGVELLMLGARGKGSGDDAGRERGEGESELVMQFARWLRSLALSSASSSSDAPR